MSEETLIEKWNLRYRDASVEDAQPAQVLIENQHLLPGKGEALDLACGLGGNAILLARQGLETQAWDLSPIVIEKLSAYASANHLPLSALVRDAEQQPPVEKSFDVIVVSRYLDRNIPQSLVDALKPDGLLFYQTFTRAKVSDQGPSNPEYRLAENELLTMFSSLQILVYREEDTVGDVTKGFRNEAMLIGQKINKQGKGK